MTKAEEVRGIRHDAVSEWLERHIEGASSPFTFTPIAGGHSNLTYRVVGGDDAAFVLRRPPIGSLLATAHDMVREHRIISALAPTTVPVPPALGLCSDESINDAPFYVMGWVDGQVLADNVASAAHTDVDTRPRLGGTVIEVLANLHAVDLDAVGLGTLGRKQDYLARQLKRWSRQWQDSKTRELAAMEEVSEGLARLLPEQVGTAIVHGDYRLGNMLVSPAGEVAAVLDWELCTLGDALADVGYLLNSWGNPGEKTANGAASLTPSALEGFPTRDHLLDEYERRTGRDVTSMPYYQAFQHWRSAAIAEGVLDRYLQGKMAGEIDTAQYSQRVEELALAALESINRL